jgi:hypothetical protein
MVLLRPMVLVVENSDGVQLEKGLDALRGV